MEANVSSRWRVLLFLSSAILESALAVLSIEELNSVNYDIDILNKPVLNGQVASGSVMYLKSRFGQEYQCSLPELTFATDDRHRAEDPAVASKDVDIAELLRPLENAPCLTKTKEWWTYEFCYGKYVRQYHLEDTQISGIELTLGVYESEYDWKNDSKTEESSRNRLQRYHSQYYVNGTQCDLTGRLRRAEVRFLCEEGAGDYIARVDEPESCRYILSVHTSHVCHHPYLRPHPNNKPHPIMCNPVLTADQYEEYLVLEEEQKKSAEEKRRKWLAEQVELVEKLKRKTSEIGDKVETEESEPSSLGDDDKAEDEDTVQVELKVIGQSDLDRMSKKFESKSTPSDSQVVPSEINDDQELEDVSAEEKVQLAGMKESIQHSIEQEFSNIIEEAEDELDQELAGNEDREDAFRQLAATLNKLLKRLDNAEQDLNHASKTLEKVQQAIDTQQYEESNLLDDVEEDDKSSSKSPTFSGVKEKENDKLVSNDKENLDQVMMREKQIESTQKQQLETAIRQKLQQSGVDISGRKIEVKIISAGYYNNEESGEYHILSDEDSNRFQNLIVSFLAANQEAAEQIERQQRLEDNYKFVWSRPRRSNHDNNEDD